MQSNMEALRASLPYIGACELRMDQLTEPVSDFPARVAKLSPHIKTILTLRSVAEGGACALPDGEQLRILEAHATQGWDYVDVELRLADQAAALMARARAAGARIICSAHFFDAQPASVSGLLKRLKSYGDVAKLAVRCDNSESLERLLTERDVVPEGQRIIIGMGEAGTITRAASAALGNLLTYCVPIDPDHRTPQTAPGQIRCDQAFELYREHQQSATTDLFAIAGNPVRHSQSPRYHNAVFRETGRDAVYVPMLVTSAASLMRVVRSVGFAGLSVTLPHKESIISELDAHDGSVREIGSCNTVIARDAGYVGTNTDVGGFMRPLMERGLLVPADLPEDDAAEDDAAEGAPLHIAGAVMPEAARVTSVLVLGAGGVARTAVYALVQAGCSVIIANRTVSRAHGLADDAWSWVRDTSQRIRVSTMLDHDLISAAADVDLIVQTTSVGMEPDSQRSPVPSEALLARHICYDLVYTPEWTLFLKEAKAAGCECISGIEMFAAQADLQAGLFAHSFRPATH